MANTHTPQGRTTPTPATSATTHHTTEERRAFAALEAANCAALARWYAARHRHTEAARKLRQALAALRRLAAFERAEAAA